MIKLKQMYYNYLKFIFLLLAISLLNACATTHNTSYHKISWQTSQKQLSQAQNWKIKGSIAIKTPKQAFSASLSWQQNYHNYTINLFGPLGIGAINIDGHPNQVTLQTNHQETFTAENPEQLLQQQLGWHLPLSNLHYWIRGISAPNIEATKKFDHDHHLTYLKQQGWEIQYLNYIINPKGFYLPTKLFLNNEKLSIRLIVSQWSI